MRKNASNRISNTLNVNTISDFLQQTESQLEQREIPLDTIVVPKYQPRAFVDGEKLDSLARSILEHGLKQRPLVRPLEGNVGQERYELVYGLRRYLASKQAQLSMLPVDIAYKLDDQDAVALALLENLQREELNQLEVVDGLLNLLQIRLGVGINEVVTSLQTAYYNYQKLSETLGEFSHNDVIMKLSEMEDERCKLAVEAILITSNVCSFTWQTLVTRYLPILNKPPEVLDAVRQGKVALSHALEIAKHPDPERRRQLLEVAAVGDASVRELRETIRSEKAAHQTSRNVVLDPRREARNRLRDLSSEIVKSKAFEDGRRRRRLERLLKELEQLIRLPSTSDEG